MTWFLWAILLISQNAAFTLVSRARNSNSIWYHAWASFLSNGVWFAANLILVQSIVEAWAKADALGMILLGVFYTACTMTGSLGMHWLALHKIEKRNPQYSGVAYTKP